MVCSSCSTTRTVLPSSRMRRSRRDEPAVVALVQADGRLVEDVEDAAQAGPDLGRQPDALGLAARERGRRPVEMEVGEAELGADRQSRLRISLRILEATTSSAAGDSGLRPSSTMSFWMGSRLQVVDAPPVDPDGQALGLEAGAAARGADILGQLDLAPLVGLGPVAEAVAVRAGAVGAVEGEVARLELGQADVAVGADQAPGEVGLPAARAGRGGPRRPTSSRAVCDGLAQARTRCRGATRSSSTRTSAVWALVCSRTIVPSRSRKTAVHADLDEALLEQAVEEPVVLALAALDDRGQDADLLPRPRTRRCGRRSARATAGGPRGRRRGSAASRPGRRAGGSRS